MLISQQYIIIERFIKDNCQRTVELRSELKLYHDRIVSKSEHFLLADILDMSYKPFSSEQCLLYFHTVRGVYSFHLTSKPIHFIKIFRELKTGE
ncbi:hypothetical protein [Bacillus massilinigeriensis]|uniref:hypothetical protein n=1 Tax=Bacillus mediterraneensis TaxID=1805474 RepID=UPI0008F92FEE|nr:hypothetical protein [Bacillus mediterraneensis]